jgi:hypothetical protein
VILHIITVLYVICESEKLKETDMGRSCSMHMSLRNACGDLDRKPEREICVQMEGCC